MPKLGPLELVLILIIIPFYFIPLIIAAIRHHPSILAIGLINAFLGWSFLGWVGALIWSVWKIDTSIKPETLKTNPNALAIAEERFAKGEITSDEFDKIKSRLT